MVRAPNQYLGGGHGLIPVLDSVFFFAPWMLATNEHFILVYHLFWIYHHHGVQLIQIFNDLVTFLVPYHSSTSQYSRMFVNNIMSLIQAMYSI